MPEKAKIKLLTETATLPTKGSEKSAGWDIYADNEDEIVIFPGETAMLPTGLAITPPPYSFIAIYARSGLASKHGINIATGVSVGDEDYTGEYKIPLHNQSNKPFVVKPHERICQFVFSPYIPIELEQVEELEETERGNGGFGSTGR